VYLRFGNRRTQRLDFGIGAQADLRSREERYLVSSQTKLSKVWSNLGSSPSWLRFKYPDVPNHQSVASNWMYPGQNESRCLKKGSPFALASLFTASDSKHVEIAHQVAFQLWICMRHERRKDEFNDQQTAVLRNHRAAVLENSNSFRVPIPFD
jgi:hypothetical protein